MNSSAPDRRIRVLVVDDSAFMRAALSRMIASDSQMEAIGTARSGTEALEKIPDLNPDVVTLDIAMPGLDGVETLKRIMQDFPRPVIMVSASTVKDAEITLSALSAGAFDYVPKELSPESLDIAHIRADLLRKIRAAASSRCEPHSPAVARKPPQSWNASDSSSYAAPAVVAIGTSTGGPRALEQILPKLPADLPVPVLIVQHMPVGFTGPFARRLDSLCALQVREASQGELIQPAVAYIAPASLHMRVRRRLSDSKPILLLDPYPQSAAHIPSVDILLLSVAKIYKNSAIGVIMTGMGADGAEGMSAIYREGGLTLGQDEATCAVYGMPRVCAELGVLRRVLPLADIPTYIVQAVRRRKRA